MNEILNKIILKSKNEYEEYDFSKLSDYKKVLILKLLLNFTQINNIEQFDEVYIALYDVMEKQSGTNIDLINSIEQNIQLIDSWDLNILINVLINNKYGLTDISQLKHYEDLRSKYADLYANMPNEEVQNGFRISNKERKIGLILQYYFNINRIQAQQILNKYGKNDIVIEKYKNIFNDLNTILNLSDLPLKITDVEISRENIDIHKQCNYYSLDYMMKKEFGKSLCEKITPFSSFVTLNQIQKAQLRQMLRNSNYDENVVDEMYQIPFYSNGDLQPFLMMVKGIRYTDGEFGDYDSVYKTKLFNSVSCISNNMISMFAESKFYIGYNINANDVYLASTRDGGADYGFDCQFDSRMADERYLNLDDFIAETAMQHHARDFEGNDMCTLCYNEIIITENKPSFLMCLKFGDSIKNIDEIIEAKKRFSQQNVELPILVLNLEECLKTQINNIVEEYKNFILNNADISSLDDVFEMDDKIKSLYIQSLATVTFIENSFGIKILLKQEISNHISDINKKNKMM